MTNLIIAVISIYSVLVTILTTVYIDERIEKRRLREFLLDRVSKYRCSIELRTKECIIIQIYNMSKIEEDLNTRKNITEYLLFDDAAANFDSVIELLKYDRNNISNVIKEEFRSSENKAEKIHESKLNMVVQFEIYEELSTLLTKTFKPLYQEIMNKCGGKL